MSNQRWHVVADRRAEDNIQMLPALVPGLPLRDSKGHHPSVCSLAAAPSCPPTSGETTRQPTPTDSSMLATPSRRSSGGSYSGISSDQEPQQGMRTPLPHSGSREDQQHMSVHSSFRSRSSLGHRGGAGNAEDSQQFPDLTSRSADCQGISVLAETSLPRRMTRFSRARSMTSGECSVTSSRASSVAPSGSRTPPDSRARAMAAQQLSAKLQSASRRSEEHTSELQSPI